MRQWMAYGAAALMCGLGAPVGAQPATVTVTIPPPAKNPRPSADAEIAEAMAQMFKAEPLTPEQEMRLPLAREVVGAMTPDGFYADVMDEMMSGMLQPLFAMIGDEGMAEETLERQVGLATEEQPELSEAQRAQVLALLDPAAKERAAAVTTGMTEMMRDISREIEAPFRDGLSRAFAVRFGDGELRDIQRFFATPSGTSFARQSVALYSDPQVMSAMMSIVPKIMESVPRMMADLQQATAKLPKRRDYADLSVDQRRQLSALLGMSEADLRRAMTKAERERAKQDQADD